MLFISLLSLSLSISLTLSFAHSLTHPHTPTLTHSLTLFLSLSLSHTPHTLSIYVPMDNRMTIIAVIQTTDVRVSSNLEISSVCVRRPSSSFHLDEKKKNKHFTPCSLRTNEL